MADNIPPEAIEQELESRFRIPNELFTDVFKLLSRSILVRKIAPVSRRFKAICDDKYIKNIHVIKQASRLIKKLEKNREARRQFGLLSANMSSLANQFRITKIEMDEREESKMVIRHCVDAGLLQGCQISMNKFSSPTTENWATFEESLALLERTKPIRIDNRHFVPHFEPDQLIRHPTVWNCTRIQIGVLSSGPYTAGFMRTLFEWLHQKPIELEGDAVAVDPVQQVRGLIIGRCERVHIESLLEHCVHNFQQSQITTDRRQFVFSFWQERGFVNRIGRIEKEQTGETLQLELGPGGHASYQHQKYRLRRCLAEEIGRQAVFYAEMFENMYDFVERFNIDENESATVEISAHMETDWQDPMEGYSDDADDWDGDDNMGE